MAIQKVKDLIGNTPLVEVEGIAVPNGSRILAKLEMLNPGGSVKDRLGVKLLQDAFDKGLINLDSTIIEPTAGNTGIGLALAAQTFGLKTVFTVPEKFSVEKQQLMQALGGEIVHTPTADGIVGAIEKARELQQEIPNSYIPLQFENPANPLTYYETLGPEIRRDVEGEKVASFVAGAGSGGTFTGTATYLKEWDAQMRTAIVEPEGSIIGGGPAHGHETEGIGMEFLPEFMKPEQFNAIYTISDEEAFFYVKELAAKSGLLVGSSSGAAFAASMKEAEKLPPGSIIVTIFPDSSDRYLSKNIYQKENQIK